jgi:CDP-6-deoxy-D-xylo-4-hexulose-3-dehydrase
MNRIQWDKRELDSIEKVFESDWFGYGEQNRELEKKLAEYSKIPYFNLTNSGSTAIWTALKVLIHEKKLKRGDLIIHPITTFPTSISSAIDSGLVPVFIETKQDTYVADEDQVERAIKKYPNIKGMILPYLLGNIPNMEKIRNALGNRILIEDCCDTLGGTFDGLHIGSFGDFAAFSFYGSHHITAGGVGGAIATKDTKLSGLAKSMIFWGHDYDVEQTFLNRYEGATVGSDFQMSAIQAAFALAQISKLPEFVKARAKQFEEMKNIFQEYNFFHTPISDSRSSPSWFCFPLRVKENTPFTRENFVYYLKQNNIEIRPIMNANILRQKPYQGIERITLNKNYPVADDLCTNGLFIPCWGMPENQKQDYHQTLKRFLDSYS